MLAVDVVVLVGAVLDPVPGDEVLVGAKLAADVGKVVAKKSVNRKIGDGITTVYRKQDHPDSLRLFVDEAGNVRLKGEGKLYVNMSGDISHSRSFRGGGEHIVAFDMPNSYVNKILDSALPQRKPKGFLGSTSEWRRLFRNSPEISDPSKSPGLIGIPSNMLDEFMGNIIQGSGRIIKGWRYIMTTQVDELQRLIKRPKEPPRFSLAVLEIKPFGDLDAYARRLREVIFSGIELSLREDFNKEELDSSKVPVWFINVTDRNHQSNQDIPDYLIKGCNLYYQIYDNEEEWSVQEWLFCFDPQCRNWIWWDLTIANNQTLFLWIDTRGEPIIACQELRWAAFAAGAEVAHDLVFQSGEIWTQQLSVGL